MHAGMLPNYFCYESVGLVWFFTRALIFTGLYYSYMKIFCNPRTAFDKALYICLCSQQKDKRTFWNTRVSRRTALRRHWISPGFDPCTPEYKYRWQVFEWQIWMRHACTCIYIRNWRNSSSSMYENLYPFLTNIVTNLLFKKDRRAIIDTKEGSWSTGLFCGIR